MTEQETLKEILQNQEKLSAGLEDIVRHLDKTTDKNLLLLSESYTKLARKVNEIDYTGSRNLLYQIEVNYLVNEVKNLKRQVEDLKNRIA